MSYTLLEPLLNDEVIRYNRRELYCDDIMRSAIVKRVEEREHCLNDWFASPLLKYVEPDRIITLADLKKGLYQFFLSWRSTKESLDFLMESVKYGCIESRGYFFAGDDGERSVGTLIGLWWSAMPKNERLKVITMYGRHEFETWIAGTRPGMNSQNTLYMAQIYFVLEQIRKDLFEHAQELVELLVC